MLVLLLRSFVQPTYRQYLEFALKLGYSERLVQLALGRLGNPTNNELLAELIKLGSQPGSNGKLMVLTWCTSNSFSFFSSTRSTPLHSFITLELFYVSSFDFFFSCLYFFSSPFCLLVVNDDH